MGNTITHVLNASQGSPAAAKTVQGFHVCEISGYSYHRGRPGESGRSPVFSVCGYEWKIVYYLRGLTDNQDYLELCLQLQNKKDDTRVVASVKLSFVDLTGSSPHHTVTAEFDSGRNDMIYLEFMKRSELEASPYLRFDRIIVACHIAILKEAKNVADVVEKFAKLPPSNITDHLSKLLREKEGTDVVFNVGKEDFPAHKTVLAMRSPVFKAELYGEMSKNDPGRITIGDMQPAVFEALLHFIYTDSLSPAMDRLGGNDYKEMTRHLLVTADRYAMERLKIICESILCETIDVKTVMTTLALADRYHCGRLKDACIKFIASLGTREIDGVMASKGYVELKATSPSALVELWEKTSRIRNSKPSLHMLV
ncbi:BTB/POZ and MATH domain-containing protein 1-like [Lolium perenne]|uniref:BTB/POZ and MATH domain-containing protein 1-like n=1 Tax=Lolium perenne TaxID=4522 RepID=UPI0021F59D19|nr:BTB/POZ and MATH domain-containing protein 1-like [Lolium perenne]